MTVQPFSATAPVKALAGSNTEASITFTGDTDTGLYSPGSNQVAVTTGGTQRLLIDGDGNITVANRFSIPLGTQELPSLYFGTDINTGLYSPGADQLALSTSGTGRLFVDASGTVSIGTSASPIFGTFPRPCFYIKQFTDLASGFAGIHVEAAGEQSVLGIGYDGTAQAFAFDASYRETGAFRPIAFKTSNQERLRITSAGLVGIGTSEPEVLLDVQATSGNAKIQAKETTTNRLLQIEANTAYHALYGTGAVPVFLYSNGSIAMTLDASQRVGIGTTSPAKTFDCLGDVALSVATNGTRSLAFRNSTIGTDYATITYTDADGLLTLTDSYGIVFKGTTERARIDSSGRLLVGTSSDSGGALLQVNGDRVRIATAKTPASATDTGTTGEVCWDANYVYVCTATNTWKRSALSTW